MENEFVNLEALEDLELLTDGDQVQLIDGVVERNLFYLEEASGGYFYRGGMTRVSKSTIVESDPKFKDGKIVSDIPNFQWDSVPSEPYLRVLGVIGNAS